MNTKLIVSLVIVGALAVTLIGVVAVSAQIATTTPTPSGTAPNGAPYNGFFGWMGRCLGFRGAPYYGTGTSAIVPQQPLNITVTDPNTNTTSTYQSYGYGAPFIPSQPQNITVTNPYTGTTTTYQGNYGYGYGGCMRGFYP
jgi:hypothetical protein